MTDEIETIITTYLRTIDELQMKNNKVTTDKTYEHQETVVHLDRQNIRQNNSLLGRYNLLLQVV